MSERRGTDFEFENGKITRLSNVQQTTESEISDATATRLMLESYRETRARKKAIKRTLFICTIIIAVAAAASAAVFLFFRIDSVSITGSEIYTEQELKQALDLPGWANLLFTQSGAVETRLREAFPSLDEIEVEKTLPDKLKITVKDGQSKYYMAIGGDIYLLDDTLKVLGTADSVPEGLTEIISCDVTGAVTGQTVSFKTSTHYNYLVSLLDRIESHGIGEHICCVDMSGKFNVKLRYDDRFTIVIGDAENSDIKLTLAENIISALSAEDRGIIDATDIERCSFRKTNS